MLWIEPKKRGRNKNAWLYDRSYYQREGMIPTLICYAGNRAAAAAVIVGP